jgi:hypothetical protein
VLIAGGRHFTNYLTLRAVLDAHLANRLPDVELLTTGDTDVPPSWSQQCLVVDPSMQFWPGEFLKRSDEVDHTRKRFREHLHRTEGQ